MLSHCIRKIVPVAYLSLFISSVVSLTHAAPQDFVVVYDITATFIVNQQTIRKEVPGMVNGAFYALSKWTSKPAEAIEQDFRTLLASLGKQQGATEMLVRDPEGRIVSELLSQWLSGAQSASNLVQCIKNYAEYDIFKDIAKTIFNDGVIARHTNAAPGITACIEQSEQLAGPNRLYLIGNWDPGSFILLARMPQHQTIFSRIPAPNCLVSGLTRLLMPRNADLLFNRIATQAQVPLDHIIFVSNMPYHISAAQRIGVKTVSFASNNPNLAVQSITAILKS